MNWSNYFAVKQNLGQPITRETIFPEGTKGMNEEEVLNRAHEFLKPYSTKWNFGQQTTEMDPNVLPEVIDADFRETAMKINSLPFARTSISCAGHPDKAGGYSASIMGLLLDAKSPAFRPFLDRLKDYCAAFSRQNKVRAGLKSWDVQAGELVGADVKLNIPENFKTCKQIRDEFWEGVGKIANGFN